VLGREFLDLHLTLTCVKLTVKHYVERKSISRGLINQEEEAKNQPCFIYKRAKAASHAAPHF
jgi:hypothetical protein